jgi:hypothetical protein
MNKRIDEISSPSEEVSMVFEGAGRDQGVFSPGNGKIFSTGNGAGITELKQRSPDKDPPQDGLKVLATYLDWAGYRRYVTAMCVPAGYEECNCEDLGCEYDCRCEYDEERDRNYVCAGWYELIGNLDKFFVPIDGDVDGWWSLPEFSEAEK